MLLAAIAFVSIAWAATALSPWQHRLPALGWAAGATAVGTMLGVGRSALRPALGLIERDFYASMLAWLVVVAVRLATL